MERRRMRARVSIAGLMMAVLGVAVGTAALRQANGPWASGIFTGTLAILSVVGLGALIGRRPGWVGAAIFGWGYLVLAFAPWFESEMRPKLLSTRSLDLAEARLRPNDGVISLSYVVNTGFQRWPTLSSSPSSTAQTWDVITTSPPSSNPVTNTATPATPWTAPVSYSFVSSNIGNRNLTPLFVSDLNYFDYGVTFNPTAFQRIGQSLWALLFAAVGAFVARGFARREDATA